MPETIQARTAMYVVYGSVLFPPSKMTKRQLDPEGYLVQLYKVAFKPNPEESFSDPNDDYNLLTSLNACMELKVP